MTAKPFTMPKLSRRARAEMRRQVTMAQTTIGCGGLPKRHSSAKPITLRRADYEAQKQK
jgi:hypothetical protein